MNYIANYIIQNGAVNREFLDKHVNIRMANTDIGYGLRPKHPLEVNAKFNGYPGADGKPIYPEMARDAVLFGGMDPGRFNPTYMIFCESFIKRLRGVHCCSCR